MDSDAMLGWVLAGVAGIIASLTAAVTSLWSRSEAGHRERAEKQDRLLAEMEVHLTRCEERNYQLRIDVDRLNRIVKTLEERA